MANNSKCTSSVVVLVLVLVVRSSSTATTWTAVSSGYEADDSSGLVSRADLVLVSEVSSGYEAKARKTKHLH